MIVVAVNLGVRLSGAPDKALDAVVELIADAFAVTTGGGKPWGLARTRVTFESPVGDTRAESRAAKAFFRFAMAMGWDPEVGGSL